MDHRPPSNLPPRKLRSHLAVQIHVPNDKFLHDDGDDDDQVFDFANADDIYSSDEFRMYEFKVRRCTRARSHDWTDCPFAHPGEKARRRDPRKHHYSAAVCPGYKAREGNCVRGDSCEFAHGVFESWLHPARYRTTPCKDGRRCRRKVCFFAHTRGQLRVLTSSPTSTLVGFAGWCSSPVTTSPVVGGRARGTARYGDQLFDDEMVSRLEAVEISPAVSGAGGDGGGAYAPDLEWVDELLE